MDLESKIMQLEQEYMELKKIYENKLEELEDVIVLDLEMALIIYKMEEKDLIKYKQELIDKLIKLREF